MDKLSVKVGLAILGLLPATASFAFEDQWQPSTKTLSAYIAEGYVMSQPIVLQLSPFDRKGYRYFLTKGQAIAQCAEDVTTRNAVVVDKVLSCADLVTPFKR